MAVENSRVLIIVNNWGIEETELTRPLRDLKAAGAKVTLAATTLDPCETVQHDRYEGETLTPDALLSDVQTADYDLLVVPGGTCNVDRIRVNEDAIALAQESRTKQADRRDLSWRVAAGQRGSGGWQDRRALPLYRR